MAKKRRKKKTINQVVRPVKSQTEAGLSKELTQNYERDFNAISEIRNTWEEKEQILLGIPKDSGSKSAKSKVFDPRLSTLVFERAARTMAQLPTGRVQAFTKKDKGKSLLMDLILNRYIIPNASSQYDILTKLKLLEVYSLVYGSFGVLVDYVVKKDYIGPDFFLIPIRDLVPQAGRNTINDCDYVYVRSVVSKQWLLSRDRENWKNIDKLLESDGTTSISTDNQSYIETKYGQATGGTPANQGMYELITRYEPDRWVTFTKDGVILRDIPNPQKNGKLPVVIKHTFPLIDRFWGLGEFERGKTLQYAINSLINLYLDGVKMSIFPPLKVYLPDVVAQTLQNEPAAKWIVKNGNMSAIQQMPISPSGINTFQQTYSFLIAALLNQAGTTDTTVTRQTDPGLGKTPKAIEFIKQRENARDNWERFMMERAVEEIYDRFIDLVSKRQETPMTLRLSKADIEPIQAAFPDVAEIYESGKAGEIKIKPDDVKDVNYKFYIDPGTTAKKDELIENQTLISILTLFMKSPELRQEIQKDGYDISLTELVKRVLITSGVQDWEKIFTPLKEQGQAQPQGQVPPQGGEMPPGGEVPPMEQMPGGSLIEGLPPEQAQLLQELVGGR